MGGTEHYGPSTAADHLLDAETHVRAAVYAITTLMKTQADDLSDDDMHRLTNAKHDLRAALDRLKKIQPTR